MEKGKTDQPLMRKMKHKYVSQQIRDC